MRLLEAIREAGVETKLYQAGTLEMFGSSPPSQSEDTPVPSSEPECGGEAYAAWMTRYYRRAYGMHAVTGIGTEEAHTVRELCEVAFGHVGLDWEPFVEIDPAYYPSTEVQKLRADPSKAEAELGWKPLKGET